jgi:hypothetical protein
METFDERLRRYMDGRPVNIFGWMTVWAQNELVPQIKRVNKSGNEVLLFVGCHTFIQGFMEKTYGIRGSQATHDFLSRFMDGRALHDRFSAISADIHEMRNVMAHQIYSAATHTIAFDYTLKTGWQRVGSNLHISPQVFGDQFIAALDGGRLRTWRRWTTPDLLIRQKWLFIADWLGLKRKDPLRLAVESFVKSPTLQVLVAAEPTLRQAFRATYGV